MSFLIEKLNCKVGDTSNFRCSIFTGSVFFLYIRVLHTKIGRNNLNWRKKLTFGVGWGPKVWTQGNHKISKYHQKKVIRIYSDS